MILPKMLSFIEENHMLDTCKTMILGVSGGADSVCLLLLMKEICTERGITPVVIHIEHGIRGEESVADARFVENLCEKLGVTFQQYSFSVEKIAKECAESTEEAGRRLRYESFSRVAEQYEAAKIAVAHNQDDNAETMLLNLARGTGLRGLCGIPPVRGNIIRPLLCVDRAEIEAFLAQKKQPYRTDATNLLDAYARNRIRHDAMKALSGVNERAVAHMQQTAEMVRDAVGYLEAETKRAAGVCAEKAEGGVLLKDERFCKYDEFMQKQILYELFTQIAENRKDIAKEHIDKIFALRKRQVGKRVDLPYECMAKRTYDGVYIGRREAEGASREKTEQAFAAGNASEHFRFQIIENNAEIGEIPKNKYTKWFDYDRINLRLQIRTRQAGDYFILDESGQKKQLKSYFINEKIPKELRDQILLLAAGNHILWVVGYRISAYYKVTEKTKRILEVQFNGGKKHE